MDRLDAMQVFLTVAEEGGFAAAARRLRRSPPSITRIISALEAHLGARLLARTTRVVRLTEAGERFAGEARKILAELEEAEATAAGSHRGLRGGLRLTAPMMFGALHVAPIALEFLEQHREAAVRAVFADRVVDLAEEGFDVAVRIAELADSSVRAVRVGSVRTVLCASPAYLRQHGRPTHPRQLEARRASDAPDAGHEAIAFHPAMGEVRWRFLVGGKRVEVAPRARLVVNSTEVAMAAALAGRGVVRSLSYLVAGAVRSGALQLLLEEHEPPPTPVHVVIPEGRQAAARVRAFVELATERLRAALEPGGPAALPERREEREPRKPAKPAKPRKLAKPRKPAKPAKPAKPRARVAPRPEET